MIEKLLPWLNVLKYVAVAAVGAGLIWFGASWESNKRDRQQADAERKLKEKSDAWQSKFDQFAAGHAARLDFIDSQLNAALIELRNRPARSPESSKPACKGATGRELSREDAEFLTREAARADKQRSALEACYDSLSALK